MQTPSTDPSDVTPMQSVIVCHLPRQRWAVMLPDDCDEDAYQAAVAGIPAGATLESHGVTRTGRDYMVFRAGR